MTALTPKQIAFVEYYLICGWNAAEAAKRAGYSPKTARQQGSRLLTNVDIQAYRDARLAELKMGADEVLTRLSDMARGDIGEFLTPMGLIDLDKVGARGKSHLIKKIKQRTTTVSRKDDDDFETHEIELELYDAQAALRDLGRHHKLFTDKIEVKDDWRKEAADAGVNPDETVETIEGVLTGRVKLNAGDAA